MHGSVYGCQDPLVLFGSEDSAFTLPLCLLSPRIIMFCHCSSTVTQDLFLIILYGTKCRLCVSVPLNPYSFIHSTQGDGDIPKDLLTTLMLARDEDTLEGLSNQDLRDHIMTFLFAGHEVRTYS